MPDPDEMTGTSEKQDQERMEKHTDQEKMQKQAEELFFFREIAMGLFHQLGNYLHSVSSGLLIVETLSEKGQVNRAEIVEQTKRMRMTIRTSMELIYKMQKRGIGLEPILRHCSLIHDIVRPVLDYVKERVSQSITIDHSLSNMDYRVYVDSDLVREALINIFNNAVWSIKENTRMRKKNIFVAVRKWDTGDFVKIVITDTGIGIAPEVFAKLFTPFFTTRSDGTGLGLYFARAILEQCQGSIAITRSAPGKGTTVEIKLPISE